MPTAGANHVALTSPCDANAVKTCGADGGWQLFDTLTVASSVGADAPPVRRHLPQRALAVGTFRAVGMQANRRATLIG